MIREITEQVLQQVNACFCDNCDSRIEQTTRIGSLTAPYMLKVRHKEDVLYFDKFDCLKQYIQKLDDEEPKVSP